jgi:uncharacterized protein YbjT (DUF2867 family)
MKIVIANPTSNVGRRVLTELLAPEFSVRVIVRDPSRLPEYIRKQVQIVSGSMEDPTMLRRALDGAEALFWCMPSASLREINVRVHYERLAAACGRAIRDTETLRVVTISAPGKMMGLSAGPISGLHAMEDILNQSGASIRHLHCGWFMENFLLQGQDICRYGILSYPIPGDTAMPMAAAKDIADVTLRWLVRRDWIGIKTIPIHGPQDLSFDQAAAIIERVLERPVRYVEVPAEDYIRKLVRSGASVHHARSVASMFAALGRGILRVDKRTEQSTTSTTLAAWTRSELLPVAKATALQMSPNAASAVLPKAQPAVSLFAYGRSLQGFSVVQPHPDEFQLFDGGHSGSVTKGIAGPMSLPYPGAFAQCCAGEGI